MGAIVNADRFGNGEHSLLFDDRVCGRGFRTRRCSASRSVHDVRFLLDPYTALSASGSAFSGLSCYASTNCVFVGLNGNQPVSVSTGGGNPVPVTAQVRAQKDEVRR